MNKKKIVINKDNSKVDSKVKTKGFTLRTDIEKARASALASLCMREHSIKELSVKLARKEYQHDSIEIVIKECLENNYLNDKRFAEIYWRSRARKGFGPNKINMELKSKGIGVSMANDAFNQDELDFEEVIKRVYLKKFKDTEIENFEDKAKRQNYLYQRGFNMDYIRIVISS